MTQTVTYYIFTVLFVGVPSLFLFVLAFNCFLVRYRGRGIVSLLGSFLLSVLLVYKLYSPDWSLLVDRMREV